jgi:hypothetical protein
MNLCRLILTGTSAPACRARAAVGAVAWLAGVALLQPGWGAALLLLAPLVAVPLGLALLAPEAGAREGASAWRVALVLQLPAALLLLAGLTLPAGLPAAAFTLPWLAFTILLALAGALRLRGRGRGSVAELCCNAGLVYVAVGGGWTTLTALGARPLDLPPEIVRATAVHFHYAGLVLPLLAGLLVRAMPTRTARLAAVGVVAGVPLVAAGITLSAFGVRLPELIAAWALAAVTALLALLQLRLAARPGRTAVRVLLGCSGLALVAGMALAALYALGNFRGDGWLDVPLMVRTHGLINALGFALPGLLAWNLTGPTGRPGDSAVSARDEERATTGAGA